MSSPTVHRQGKATRRVVSTLTGPFAWCARCQMHMPASQVPWAQMRTYANGHVATYAPITHEVTK